MPEQVKAVPTGFHTLTPHLTVRDADNALEFYKNALGAEVLHVARMPNGKVMHAALRIGDSMLMLNEEFLEYGNLSPLSSGGAGVTIHIYTENVDEAFNRALSAGAQVKMPLMDQFWGARQRHVAGGNAARAGGSYGKDASTCGCEEDRLALCLCIATNFQRSLIVEGRASPPGWTGETPVPPHALQ